MRRVTGERGAVSIMFVPWFLALLGFAALTIDVGILLVEKRALRNGADASALAVARDCVAVLENPPGATPCTSAAALATTNVYFAANSPIGVTADRTLTTSNGGKVGSITVTGRISQMPVFGQVLGVNAPFDVGVAARARWGPVVSYDDVFPLVVCRRALPAPDSAPEALIAAPPPASPPPGDCQGDPSRPPFGWMAPDDPAACSAQIDLLLPTTIDVDLAQNEPGAAGCASAIDDLHDDIDTGTAEERTRVLAIYDHRSGVPSARPAWALVVFEFTGAKLGGRISHSTGLWTEPCDPADATLRCIEGIVRHDVPIIDGPIVDPSVASFPGIDDSTLLDVRLTD